jgi:hypothetical protein
MPALQALKAWIRTSVPSDPTILQSAKLLPPDMLSAGAVLSAALGCATTDVSPHFGILPGLSQVCLAGTRIVAADLAPLVDIQAAAHTQIVAALRKVCHRYRDTNTMLRCSHARGMASLLGAFSAGIGCENKVVGRGRSTDSGPSGRSLSIRNRQFRWNFRDFPDGRRVPIRRRKITS